MTVGEVLAHLKISAPMWSMIRARERDPAGKAGRSPSIKTIRRIEQAEREAGLTVAGKRFTVGVVREDTPGDYITRNQSEEMRRDLLEVQENLAALTKRVNEILKKIGKKDGP